ncbi:aminodeoxychorismate/anthranilate synthase component II [Virgibacillus sp. LDC-1]|uniref:anthranilate synthase component II n=1 Tax=Virgibacillus sp. LDC-1 TaxID=3039856 RepID=UPI0024DE9288|nr:aminodeoxychorismate/anthranilate synthase component II [Virgibacillus sp. LDC-1]
MLLIVDNYDSFTFNIEQYFKKLEVEVEVWKNDHISISEIEERNPSHIVISPGPHAPNDAGISLETINHFKGKIPILGICLGHQAIGQFFGAEIVKAKQPKHGRQSMIFHNQKTIFSGIPDPFSVTRYHSLVIDPRSIPPELEVTSTSDDGEIMAIRHKSYPIEGVQFHPESILTEYGDKILQNFLEHY